MYMQIIIYNNNEFDFEFLVFPTLNYDTNRNYCNLIVEYSNTANLCSNSTVNVLLQNSIEEYLKKKILLFLLLIYLLIEPVTTII
jgi:hypothetical protein